MVSLTPIDREILDRHGADGIVGWNPVNWQIIDLCVRSAQVLGMPRSIGEIFGLIFCSPRPVSFEDVVRVLRLSNGTASHGLRYLKRIGAIRNCYVAQDRKEFFVAETSLKRVLLSLVGENFIAHLGMYDEQLERLRITMGDRGGLDRTVLSRIEQLTQWNQQIRQALSAGFDAME